MRSNAICCRGKTSKSSRKAYRAGEVGTLEVFRTQGDYNRVTAGYQETLFGYNAAKTELESVLGGSVPQ